MAKNRQQTGFTLVELLVVISIIGVLAAILLPAINAARGAARQTECINNVRQLATAVQNYEASKNSLPPYATNVANTPLVAGFIYSVLPMIEQAVIRDEIDLRATSPTLDGNGRLALQGNPFIKILQCPSNPSAETVAASSGYVANGGHHDFAHGLNPDIRPNGALSFAIPAIGTPFKVSMDYISSNDGASLTAIVSENVRWTNSSAGLSDWRPVAVGSVSDYLSRVFYPHTFWWSTAVDAPVAERGANPPAPIVNPSSEFPGAFFNENQQLQLPAQNEAQLCRDSSPSSNHQGGFVMGFADGHVVFVSENINYRVYARLITSDGRAASNGQTSSTPLNYQTTALGANELE